jgi:hypothetical protein
MRKIVFVYLIFAALTCTSKHNNDIRFQTRSFRLTLNKQGIVKELLDTESGTNFLVHDSIAPLLSIKMDGEITGPQKAEYVKNKHIISLQYPDNVQAAIKATEKESYLVFELVEMTAKERIELVIWGPYPTTIRKTIGETVGVVQGDKYALGIQALNPKTLGGYPWKDNDCMPQLDIFEGDDYSDLSEKGKRHVLYRVEAAKPTDTGSTLQAYCRNRNKERITANWGHERYTIPVFEDGGVIGSKIALFGCTVENILETIEKIELSEGLPHPQLDGQWGKTARSASAAYMILGFGEEDFSKALSYTKQAGLCYLYHPGAFKNWGHFELNDQFPSGWDSLKDCVKKARHQGIFVGVHTLSNFITTNDPYVTPVPDRRLAVVGTSVVTQDMTQGQTEIPVASPDFFNQFKSNHLKTVRIGDELIQYGRISEQAPWKLLDCQRGVFGTSASAHARGETISKLADHAYKVFLTNPELGVEMSSRIAELFNYCDLRQISFDGIEGNRSTGMGNYGEILFTSTWYNQLSDEIKSHFIADASRTSHFFWHIYTRMNWGEPWYAGFRESQTEYRLKNQKYFQRNLMPGMLGWFSMRNTTSVEDIEWMLARSAGFDAGYGFVTSYKVLEENGCTAHILRLLGEWEKARMDGAFTADQKTRMQDINREFHLEPVGMNKWSLYEVFSYKFKHKKKTQQKRETQPSTFQFENPAEEQRLQFILTAGETTAQNIKLKIDNFEEIILPVSLHSGESLKYTGDSKVILYNSSWKKIKEIAIEPSQFLVSRGKHTLNFDCSFVSTGKEPATKLELRIFGQPEKIF